MNAVSEFSSRAKYRRAQGTAQSAARDSGALSFGSVFFGQAKKMNTQLPPGKSKITEQSAAELPPKLKSKRGQVYLFGLLGFASFYALRVHPNLRANA